MAKKIDGKWYKFGEWFDRKDAAQRRARQYGKNYYTKIVPAPKESGWKLGLYYRGKSSKYK